MSSLSNAVELSTVTNYIGEAAITMLFGMGYYFVNKFKKDEKTKESVTVTDKDKENIFIGLSSLTEFHSKIKENTTRPPYEILKQIISAQLNPCVETYNLLIFNACKNGFFSEAKKLKEEIFDLTSPVYPDVQTFNLLIKGVQLEFGENGDKMSESDYSKIMDKFDQDYYTLRAEMKSRGIKATAETENIYMDILFEQKRTEKALSYFEDIHKSLEFDIYTYTTALRIVRSLLNDFHYKNKTDKTSKSKTQQHNMKASKAKEVYQKYNSKINYIKELVDSKLKEKNDDSRDSKEQVHFRAEVEAFYSALLDAFLSLKDFDQAKIAFNEYSPQDEASFVTMIRIYTFESNLKQALEMFLSLKKIKKLENKSPTISGYGAILNACAKLGNMNLAEELLQEMFNNKVYPNSYVYSNVINGYRLSGRLDLAIQAYKLAELDTDNYTVAVLNTVLNACADENEFKKLTNIFDTAVNEHGVIPDKITFSILIKAYSRHNDFDKLWDLYSFLIKNKICDEITFNSLLDVFANAEHEKNLYEIYTEMKKQKMNISVVTYGVILKLFVNLANKERSEEIYQEIIRKGLTPTIVIFQLMVKLYSYLGFHTKIWNIYKTMIQKYSIIPDAQLYDSFIRIGLKANELHQVKLFIIDALTNDIEIERYLIDSFFNKLLNSQDIDKKTKMNYSNEISSGHSKHNKVMSKRSYQSMDLIFQNKNSYYNNYNNNNYNSNNNNNNNIYNYNQYSQEGNSNEKYTSEYKYDRKGKYNNTSSKYSNDEEVVNTSTNIRNKSKNKYDIDFESQNVSAYTKLRYDSLQTIYKKCYGPTLQVGQSIYNDN